MSPTLLPLLLGLLTAAAQSGMSAIEGRVTFVGAPPAPTVLTLDGTAQPVLYVSGSGGLRYAVVHLPDAPRDNAPPAGEVTVNQRNFIFEPQVIAVRVGQMVQFTNDDPANHNVCSKIHPWMAAWVYAFEHDRVAVTAADGSFRIRNVPPAPRRIAIRQPSGRLARDLAVDVRPSETIRLDVQFSPADLGRLPR